MGGAERAERKRRQEAATRRAGQEPVSSSGVSRTTWAIAGVVALVAAVVVGVLVWTNVAKNDTEAQGIQVSDAKAVKEERSGAAVTIGKAKAPRLDVYADFLCPACGEFEHEWGAKLLEKANAGELSLRVHMLPMLVKMSDPEGYSRDSANAALCAADQGKFTPFHASLFASQPSEGNRGWDDKQLIKLGRDLRISDKAFDRCVTGGTHDAKLESELDKVAEDPDLVMPGSDGFGTPTVAGPDGAIDWTKPDWLDKFTERE